MRHSTWPALMGLGLLAACATPTAAPAPTARTRPAPLQPAGLERVLGHDATSLVQLFGDPDQDQREGRVRRLQFVGPACVLDTYLYPKGAGQPVVTWIDARTPTGEDFDRASCVAALSRRTVAVKP